MTLPITEPVQVRVERTFRAPRRAVYRAWLDPDVLQRWMSPGGLQVRRAEVDERVGGSFRIWQTDAGVDVGGFDCELVELVPDERIVFRWGFVGGDRRKLPGHDSVLTITLRDAPEGGTVLTLEHERLEGLAAAVPYVAENVRPGWESALAKLTAAIGG